MKRKLVYLMTYERIVQHDASAGCSTLCPLFCWSDFICFACLLVCLSLTAFKGGTHAFEDVDAHASPWVSRVPVKREIDGPVHVCTVNRKECALGTSLK